MRARMFMLLWLTVGVVCAFTQQGCARTLGVQLAGDELLVELCKIAPGPEPPGIYAVGEDGTLRRVLTHGECPVWSPDRTMVALRQHGKYGILNARDGDLRWLARGSASSADVFSMTARRPVVWMPQSDALILWWTNFGDSQSLGPRRTASIVAVRDGYEGASIELAHPYSVGSANASTEGRLIAYERYRMVRGIGRAEQSVHVADLTTGQQRPVESPIPDAVAVVNPQWNPSGDRLAFDVIVDSHDRCSFVMDWESGSVTRLPNRYTEEDDIPSQWVEFMEWSPNGEHAVLSYTPLGGALGTNAEIIQTLPGEPPVWLGWLKDEPFTAQACFSPSGSEIAVLQGQRPDDLFAADGSDRLTIKVSRLDDMIGAYRVIEVPDYLRVRSIDW